MTDKTKPPRILFFSDTVPGTTSLVHRSMQGELERRGFLVEMFYGQKARTYGGTLRYESLAALPIPELRAYVSIIRRLKCCDVLVLHRQGNLLAYVVQQLAKANRRTTVFDFDDALHLHHYSQHRFIHRLWYSFLPSIIKKSDIVIAGSHFLLDYASGLNQNVTLIPTPVDTSIFYPRNRPSRPDGRIVIGWMGIANYHLDNIKIIREPLQRLAGRYPLRLKLVSALGMKEIKDVFSGIDGLETDYGLDHLVRLEELPDLMSDFDISVMPLTDDDFSRGKCSMKILESMAMGLPVVASDVGENNYVIQDGVNGYLAKTSDDWVNKLEILIKDGSLRSRMGQNGFRTISEKGYSREACEKRFHKLLGEYMDKVESKRR
jgi:glycosyltransferase involved in cell wall biosynthesis